MKAANILEIQRRTGNVLVGKLDVDDVVSRFCRLVSDDAHSIGFLGTFQVGFARSFHRETQTSVSYDKVSEENTLCSIADYF